MYCTLYNYNIHHCRVVSTKCSRRCIDGALCPLPILSLSLPYLLLSSLQLCSALLWAPPLFPQDDYPSCSLHSLWYVCPFLSVLMHLRCTVCVLIKHCGYVYVCACTYYSTEMHAKHGMVRMEEQLHWAGHGLYFL